ncbi:MAG: hypothetical protein WA843_04195 [Candidatus Saccharimonadales bacterium]
MLKPKIILILFISVAASVAFSLFGGASRASALSLDPSNYTYDVTDDAAFRDNGSMSAASIQAFLNSQGGGLANFRDVENCGSTSGSHYSYYTHYYSCGTTQVAAQIIFDAAQAYGINPQAIIATLQKEQSLITTPNPTASQLNFAMGYGCPDSGGCSYAGFFNQVDNGTWQLRTDMELGSGNNWWGYTPASYPCNGGTRYYSTALKGGNTVTFYDDNGTPYNTLTLNDMSTATLYCYTPHVYNNPNGQFGLPRYGSTGQYYTGSYNFAYYYSLWFGSPTGDLLRTPTNGQIYIVNSDTNSKYPINSLGVLNDFSTLGVRFVSDAYLAQYTTLGRPVGNMVQSPDGTLYLVNAGIKLPFSSCSGDIADYGFTCDSSQFVPLTIGQANKLVSGPGVTKLIKSNANSTIYYMSNGTKRPIPSWGDLTSLNTPISYNVLTDALVSQFPTGPLLYANGSLVKTDTLSTVYIVNQANLIPIASFLYPQEFGAPLSLRTISASDFQTYTIRPPIQTKIKCGTSDYVGTNGQLYNVTASLNTFGFQAGDFLDVGSLCSNLPAGSQTLGNFIRVSNGTVYYVSAGQKQAFTNYNAYVTHGGNNSNTVSVSDYFASLVNSGANITQ